MNSSMKLGTRQKLVKEIQLILGGGMVDLEADPEHYDLAIDMALDRYRQRSSNAVEESFIFLDLQVDVDMYQLPVEVQDVRKILRRGTGGTGAGVSVDPFALAYTNNLYMINNPGGLGAGGSGMLATYDFAMQYQNLAGLMFGREVLFTFNNVTKRLHLHRKFGSVETVLLWVYNTRPEDTLLSDVRSKPWIRDYATAMVKKFIGEARSKFAQIAGPQGGSTLNGDAMKSEALAELERLEEELKRFKDGTQGWSVIIG